MNKIQELIKNVLKGKGVNLKSEDIEAYYNRGVKKCRLGQYESAIMDFDRVIDLNPQESEAYNGRGNAKNALGQHESAEEDCAKAKELEYKAQ